MTTTEDSHLLSNAIDGNGDALGSLLQSHRPYLRILAARGLDSLVSGRLSGSDIVQQTCLEAVRDFQSFRGKTVVEFLGWLRQILGNNLTEATRTHLVAQKRTVTKEATDNSDGALSASLRADVTSPSSRMMQGERAVQLARAMDELPDDQFEALRLRHLEGWTVKRIATQMDRSDLAVAGLLKRGLLNLRQRLPNPGNDQRD